ncbi:MAG: mechanosensitive ion channel [Gammaproteobacteria bacterium]|nr:mechanosensitive ion channel [Gammaproteobacteria bacterium]
MEKIFSPAWWTDLILQLETWFLDKIWVAAHLYQFVIIFLIFLSSYFLSGYTKKFFQKMSEKTGHIGGLARIWQALQSVSVAFLWLLQQYIVVWIARLFDIQHGLITLTSSLLTAWIVIRLFSQWIKNSFMANMVAVVAWIAAAANILGLLPQMLAGLDAMSVMVGDKPISLLLVIKSIVALGVLIWLASTMSDLVEKRLGSNKSFTPAAKVLFTKLFRIGFLTIATLVALNTVGIDLTALAVFSGALAVGLGFGLQKIFSNLVSGLILLLDKSIKPGDVISLGTTYGWINHLGARYVSVVTRDGTEHLIPNEELITQRVENWSHTNKLVRMRIPVGVSYDADPRLVMKLCLEAAEMVPRVLLDPAPRCLITGYGDNSVDFDLRIWINDPENGRGSVKSDVLLGIWDRFKENGVSIPYPQRDLHIKSLPAGYHRSELPD